MLYEILHYVLADLGDISQDFVYKHIIWVRAHTNLPLSTQIIIFLIFYQKYSELLSQ